MRGGDRLRSRRARDDCASRTGDELRCYKIMFSGGSPPGPAPRHELHAPFPVQVPDDSVLVEDWVMEVGFSDAQASAAPPTMSKCVAAAVGSAVEPERCQQQKSLDSIRSVQVGNE